MKGYKWESPRGPVTLDAETRDIVQNVYIRKVEKQDGELYNVEFETISRRQGPDQDQVTFDCADPRRASRAESA